MSVFIKTNNHGELGECGFCGPVTDVVRIGEYEIPIEEFCSFATYVLHGGFLGWLDMKSTPECVKQAIKDISMLSKG